MKDKSQCCFKKYLLPTVIASAIILLAAIAYLIVSLITKKWDTSYLILVGGIFAAIILFGGFLIAAYLKKGKEVIPRLSIAGSLILIFVFIYLCITVLTKVNMAWIMFLIMIIALIGADTVFAYWVNSKTRLINLIVFIFVASVLEYVVLSLVELLTWHPYWVIPLVGVLIDTAIIVISIIKRQAKTKSIEDANHAEEPAAEIKEDNKIE